MEVQSRNWPLRVSGHSHLCISKLSAPLVEGELLGRSHQLIDRALSAARISINQTNIASRESNSSQSGVRRVSEIAQPRIASPLPERREPPAERVHHNDDERPDKVDNWERVSPAWRRAERIVPEVR